MTTATATEPLYLRRLEISNFMRVEALTIDAQGHHVLITGKNGEGKTSVVQALWVAIQGLAARRTPRPIREGSDRAVIKADFGEIVVERVISEKSARLVVTCADGSHPARPQELLNGLLSALAIDPTAFLRARAQDQVDQVLVACGVRPPVEQVAALAGEPHPVRPGESADAYLMRLSADETGLYYLRRREANRQAEQKRAALEEQRGVVSKLGGPLKPGEVDTSPSAIVQQIEALQQKADERRALEEAARQAQTDYTGGVELLQKIQTQRNERAARLENLARQLEAIQRQMTEEREGVQLLDARIGKGQDVVRELANDKTAADQAVAAYPDPAPQIAALRHDLRQHEAASDQRRKRELAADQLRRLATEAEQALGEHRRLDKIVGGLRDLRAHLLDDVDLGISGLSIGDGELLHNGVPFVQASTAQAIRVACALAMRQPGRIRLLRLDEGERLDAASKLLVLELAREREFQVILTSVTDGEGLRVEIVDGDGEDK